MPLQVHKQSERKTAMIKERKTAMIKERKTAMIKESDRCVWCNILLQSKLAAYRCEYISKVSGKPL